MTTLNNDEQPAALALIQNDPARLELESDLRARVSEHDKHLETLAADLRTLGIDGKSIDHHVTQIFEKYRVELLRNIEQLAQA